MEWHTGEPKASGIHFYLCSVKWHFGANKGGYSTVEIVRHSADGWDTERFNGIADVYAWTELPDPA